MANILALLALSTCICVDDISTATPAPVSVAPTESRNVILVPDGTNGEERELVGLVDLGVVDGGSVVSIDLSLIHNESNALSINRVVRTCNCADIKVPSGTWKAGTDNALQAKLSVSVPNVLSENFRLATLQLCDDQTVIAKLSIKAAIKVPLKFKSAPDTVRITKDDNEFQYSFELLVQKDFDPQQIRISVPEWITSNVTRLDHGSEASDFYESLRIDFVANISSEEQPRSAASHVFEISQKDISFKIEKRVNFLVEQKLKVFPAQLLVAGTEDIRLVVLSRSGEFEGLDKELSISFDGVEIDKTVSRLSDSVLRVIIKSKDFSAPDSGSIKIEHVSDEATVVFSRS